VSARGGNRNRVGEPDRGKTHLMGQGIRIIGRNQVRIAARHLAQCRQVACYYRQASRHRFENRKPEAFGEGRKYEYTCRSIEGPQ
jgi:hypothetical protein